MRAGTAQAADATGVTSGLGLDRVRPGLCSQSPCPLQLQTHFPCQPREGTCSSPSQEPQQQPCGARSAAGAQLPCAASSSADSRLGGHDCSQARKSRLRGVRELPCSQLGHSEAGTVTQVHTCMGPPWPT